VNRELVDRGDLDELTRQVDRLCDARDWDGLVDLRDRCRKALERGRQLWPVASWCEYRMALDAPGPWAATVLTPGAGRFALGPLPEVAASTHTWDELADWAPAGPPAAFAAHERVARGDDLRSDSRVPDGVVELPLVLASWEPRYPLATYRPDGVDFGDVVAPPLAELALPPAGLPVADGDSERALTDLVEPWVRASNGEVAVASVEGDGPAAIAALAQETAVRAAPLEPDHAVAYMAWTAASGGAHGGRRGLAAGRFSAWWAAAALTGLLEPWPPDPAELGEAIHELRWWRWDDRALTTGWWLGLAAEDPVDGLAWAVRATDVRSPTRRA
jgi:hypothetical protein